MIVQNILGEEKLPKQNIRKVNMAKINNTLYLTDDYIFLKNKKKNIFIKSNINKGIVECNRIYNIEKFIKCYEKILRENKLNNNLIGDTIKIIVSPNYYPSDIFVLKNIFEKFNYRKVIVENEIKTYKLNNNNCYLNIFDNYMFLTYIDEYQKIKSYVINNNYYLDIEFLIKSIKNKIKDKDILIFGHGKLLQEIFSKFEDLYNNKTYLYSNFDTFIIDNN